MHISTNSQGFYLYDLKIKDNMLKYYACKERFDYRLDNRDFFIQEVADEIKTFVSTYDWIAIPESSNDFLNILLSKLNISNQTFTIKKNDIESVIEFYKSLNLQKKEKISHLERLETMGKVFKINLMKANQRRKYEEVIFSKPAQPTGKGLVIDDSCFSGTTLNGIKAVLNNFDFLAIFSK